ncbi:MAG: condensation domain-containing protein, partial [Myxococcota bacterium]
MKERSSQSSRDSARPLHRLIRELRERDIHLWVEDHQLRFRAPKGAFSSELREQVRGQRGQLIALLAGTAKAAIPRRPSSGQPGVATPLSFGQQGLWLAAVGHDTGATYNIPLPLRLRGAVDSNALERALSSLVAHHEALRTRCEERDGEPCLIVMAPTGFTVERDDLGGLPEAKREAALKQLVTRHAATPFEVRGDQLFRAGLVKLADDDWAVLMTLHHLVGDGWSAGILASDLATLYRYHSSGPRSRVIPEHILAPLPLQYTDFAAWQRQYYADIATEPRARAWAETLASVPDLVDLPRDLTPPDNQGFAGAVLSFTIPSSLYSRLRTYCEKSDLSLFMVTLGVFAVWLSRICRQREFVVGTIVAGRHEPELERLLGLFVNVLPIPLEVSEERSVADFFAAVRERCLSAFEVQDVPFEALVRHLAPTRTPARPPLVQAIFRTQSRRMLDDLDLPDITVEPLPIPRQHSSMEMSFSI